MTLNSLQAAAVAAAAAATTSDSADGGEVSALAADHIGRKAEPLDPVAEASEEGPSEPAVGTEDTSVMAQDEAAAVVGGSAADGAADAAEGDSAMQEVPLQQYQAPELPVQPSLIRSSADDHTAGTDPESGIALGLAGASATSELLLQPSSRTDEAPAVVTSHGSAGSDAEQAGTQGSVLATVAPQDASTGVQTAVQTNLPSSDRELAIAAATVSSAGDGPAFEQQSESDEDARSIDVLVTPRTGQVKQ